MNLRRVVEALLFIGSSPVTHEKLARCLPGTSLADFDRAIASLSQAYLFQKRPYEVDRTERGFVLRLTTGQASELVTRTRSDRGVKLSPHIVKTLSVVAYCQPISRVNIEKMIGVDAGSALRQLVRRQLLEAKEGESDAQVEYITTHRFLEMFGLETLEDLPTTEETF